jgi:DNA-binding transcriptional MerR regulator
MVDDEINDLFKDFEYRDGEKISHAEIKKRAQKEFDKQRAEKNDETGYRDYNEEIKELKEQIRELKEHIKGRHKGRMISEERKTRPKSPRPNIFSKPPSALERGILIGIIILLAGFIVIDLSFHHGGKGTPSGMGEGSVGMVVHEVNKSEEDNTEISAQTEEAQEVEENATNVSEEQAQQQEEKLSGKITLKIDKIYTDVLDDDMGEISKVVFTIENGKEEVLRPIVEVFAYDSKNKKDYETRSRGSYRYDSGIKAGESRSGSISLVPKIFRNLDLRKHVRLVLNDTKEGFITAVNKEVIIS